MKNQDVKFSRDTYVLAFAVCYKLVRLLPLTFRALWIRFERGFIFSLQIKLSSYEVCFPSGADISSLNVFVFRRLKLAMWDSSTVGKPVLSSSSRLWQLRRQWEWETVGWVELCLRVVLPPGSCWAPLDQPAWRPSPLGVFPSSLVDCRLLHHPLWISLLAKWEATSLLQCLLTVLHSCHPQALPTLPGAALREARAILASRGQVLIGQRPTEPGTQLTFNKCMWR